MTTKLDEMPTEKLKAKLHECWEMINKVLDGFNDAPEMQAGIRRLVLSGNMLSELNAIAAESPELANQILQFSVAMLANTHSIQAIDAELCNRFSDMN